MRATCFANIWYYYPPQYKVGLKINCNILSCRLYWLKLQHPWPRRNVTCTAPEPPNEIWCLESTENAPNKKGHLRHSLWIRNSKFGVQVLYMVYCSLARNVAVSINTTYEIGCCNWFLIKFCTEVDNNAIC